MNYIIPVVMCLIVFWGLYKQIDVFNVFISGLKDGIKTLYSILPVLILMLTGIKMFRASGGFEVIAFAISPITNLFNIPTELVPLFLMRPVSGGGSTSLLTDILSKYGADSFIGRTASVMCAAGETSIYTISVYMGGAKVKNTRFTLPLALSIDVMVFILSIIFASIL